MKKDIMLLGLHIKMAFGKIHIILLQTLVLSLLIGAFSIVFIRTLSSEEGIAVTNVALVNEDANTYTDMAVSFLFEEESVKKTCRFVETDRENALFMLNDGTVDAVVILPEDFLKGILNGENYPARIILKKSGMQSSSLVFQGLINAGASDLKTAQAAVYAALDLCRVTQNGSIDKVQDDVNRSLLMYALKRNSYYGNIVVSSTGELSVKDFYISGGIVLLLFLSGIVLRDILKRDSRQMLSCLKRQGIHTEIIPFCKLCGVSAVYSLIIIIIYLIFAALGAVKLSYLSIPGIIVLVMAVFSVSLFLFSLSDNIEGQALLLFMLTIVMMFVSGNIIPDVFLPGIVRRMGGFMPGKYMARLMGQIISGGIELSAIVICLLWGALFLILSTLALHIREKE